MARYRKVRFLVPKGGEVVKARFSGPATFKRPTGIPELISRERVLAVDTESLKRDGELATLLVPIRWHDASEVVETLDGTGMLAELLRRVLDRYGVHAAEPTPQNRRLRHACEWRPAAPKDLDPALSVWFNLAYDFGRLLADRRGALRFVAAGADTYRFRASRRLEVEVLRMFFGSSSSFEWVVRDLHTGCVARLLGADLTGYWKCSLRAAAAATGAREKVDIEAKVPGIYERDYESLSPEEWQFFREYAAGDAETTLELYHKTAEQVVQIEPLAVKSDGTLPVSAPGAAARVVFLKSYALHEVGEWERYPAWADRMGCSAYAGARSFSCRPGVYERMVSLDLKSAYPFQLAALPDPVTVRVRSVKPRAEFDLDLWRGRYGVIYVDGEGLDPIYPALRVRDERRKRVRYVYGRFKNLAVTVPEAVLGVARGALRIDRVRRGVVLDGSPERSFFRAAIRAFFQIKEDKRNGQALRDVAKLFSNSTYGKLVEVQLVSYFIAEQLPMPQFRAREQVVESIVRAFVESGPTGKGLFFGDDPEGAARAYYEAGVAELGSTLEERAVHAVRVYVEALTRARLPVEGPGLVTVGEYVRRHKVFECGHYFMPLYAAQVTGATSAQLGAMAALTGALQGDTDSVHVRLAEGFARATDMPGYAAYFDLMDRCGYLAPRLSRGADGVVSETWDGIEGMETIGGWVEETPAPSVESLLVRPKVYSHKFADGTYKQARHGFAKFHTPEVGRILGDGTRNVEERVEAARKEREAALHEAMRMLLRGDRVEYRTRPSPRRLREALVSGKPVGEFVSRLIKLGREPDPNTEVGADGYVRWREGGS